MVAATTSSGSDEGPPLTVSGVTSSAVFDSTTLAVAAFSAIGGATTLAASDATSTVSDDRAALALANSSR